MKHNTSRFFQPGKLTTIISADAGSTGKGKLGSYLVSNASALTPFVCNTFSSQASHTVVEADGTEHVYKHLCSCAHLPDKYSKMYIGQGAAITLSVILKEISTYGMTPDKLGIHPLCVIITDIDQKYEMGECGFDGEESTHATVIKSGSTCSGVGTALARKLMRRPNVTLAKDCQELESFMCVVEDEIQRRLENGESGLLEIAQGYQLSLGHHQFYPFVTSRNSTVAAGLSDMMLPVKYAGHVILDTRTYPIRIHNKKYVLEEEVVVERAPAGEPLNGHYHPEHFVVKQDDNGDTVVIRPVGSHLYWEEINSDKFAGKYHELVSNSGPGWPDQQEITWEHINKDSGAPAGTDLTSYTTLTRLPRRVFGPSAACIADCALKNLPPDGSRVFVSINFINFVDWEMNCANGGSHLITEKVSAFINDNYDTRSTLYNIALLGTGPKTNEYIDLLSS